MHQQVAELTYMSPEAHIKPFVWSVNMGKYNWASCNRS